MSTAPAENPTSEVLLDRLRDHWGSVPPAWEWLCTRQPVWVRSFCDYLDSTRTGDLDPASRHLLLVALHASSTTVDGEAVDRHVDAALAAGATETQVLEVLQLVSMLGMHTVIDGLDAIGQELERDGFRPEGDGGALREKYLAGRGYWRTFDEHFPGFHDTFIAHAPELFEAYQLMGEATWRSGALAGWLRELVFVVMDLASTHLYISGAQLHAANALHYGATPGQLVEAMRLSTVVSARTMTVGVDALRRHSGESTRR